MTRQDSPSIKNSTSLRDLVVPSTSYPYADAVPPTSSVSSPLLVSSSVSSYVVVPTVPSTLLDLVLVSPPPRSLCSTSELNSVSASPNVAIHSHPVLSDPAPSKYSVSSDSCPSSFSSLSSISLSESILMSSTMLNPPATRVIAASAPCTLDLSFTAVTSNDSGPHLSPSVLSVAPVAAITTESFPCMTGHHTKNRLSLPLSSNGGRQAWLEGCLLKVPETGAEVRLRVLWDTGAAVNVLSESFYRALGSPSLLPCRDTVIRSLNGAIQSVCGAVRLQLRLCACSYILVDFDVVNIPEMALISYPYICQLDILMGRDLLIPNLVLKHVSDPTFSPEAPPCEAVRGVAMTESAAPVIAKLDVTSYVRSVERHLIPAKSECWVHVEVPPGLQEFIPFVPVSGLFFAKGLFHDGTREFLEVSDTSSLVATSETSCSGYVLALNPSNKPVYVSHREAIGYVMPLSIEHEVAVVDSFPGAPEAQVAALDIKDDYLDAVPLPSSSSNTASFSPAIVQAITNIVAKAHLRLDQAEQLQRLLLQTKYTQLFSDGSVFPRPADLPPVELPVIDPVPVQARPYRVNPELTKITNIQLDKMVKEGVIKAHVSSPYSSPVLMVKKKSGDWRFCIDYRQLNTKLKLDVYPLPIINDVIDSLNGATIFSHLDLASGYWQLPIAEKDQPKTAFILPNGLYQFTVLPFGIATAPSIFQRAMDLVLLGLKYYKCLVYLDDIIIYSQTFPQHLLDLQAVLDRLNGRHMTVKITKCDLAASSLEFLGHDLDRYGIRPASSHVESIKLWSQPQTVADVQKFLGLTGYFRRFVKGYSTISADLHALSRGRPQDKIAWKPVHEAAFQSLKKALTTPPVLQYPHFRSPFIVCPDASDIAAGATLEQEDANGNMHVIAYFSERFNKAECKYATCERECLALVKAVMHWQQYLNYAPFQVLTDHKPLVGTFKLNSKLTENRLTRWKRALQPFTFVISYRPGSLNTAPDALSRHPLFDLSSVEEPVAVLTELPMSLPSLPSASSVSSSVASELMIQPSSSSSLSDALSSVPTNHAVTPEKEMSKWLREIADMQRQDQELLAVFTYLELGRLPYDRSVRAKVFQLASLCVLRNRLLFLRTSEHSSPRLVVPRGYRNCLLKSIHCQAGHLGAGPTYKKLALHFWWKGMWKDVNLYTTNCATCQIAKKPHHKPSGAPGHASGPAGPLEHIGIDIVGPLLETRKHNRYFFTFIDFATNWIEIYPTPDQTSLTAAKCLSKWIREFGAPLKITSDRGAAFVTDLIRGLCKLWGISHDLTSSYRPESNGKTERANQLIENVMRAMLEDHPDIQWDELEDEISFTLHTSALANGTPADLLFGMPLHGLLDTELELLIADKKWETVMDPDWLHDHAQKLRAVRQKLYQTITERQRKYMESYNRQRRVVHFFVGDLVWMHSMADDQAGKLGPRMLGPFRVVSAGPSSYAIEDLKGKKWPSPIHVSHLEACNLTMPDFDAPALEQDFSNDPFSVPSPLSSSSSSLSIVSSSQPSVPLSSSSSVPLSSSSSVSLLAQSSFPSFPSSSSSLASSSSPSSFVHPSSTSALHIPLSIQHAQEDDFRKHRPGFENLGSDAKTVPVPTSYRPLVHFERSEDQKDHPLELKQKEAQDAIGFSEPTAVRGEFEIDRILDEHYDARSGQTTYKVMWKDYPHPDWQPAENLIHCDEAWKNYNMIRGDILEAHKSDRKTGRRTGPHHYIAPAIPSSQDISDSSLPPLPSQPEPYTVSDEPDSPSPLSRTRTRTIRAPSRLDL